MGAPLKRDAIGAAARLNSADASVLYLNGPLHGPQGVELRDEVHRWLRCGHRSIEVCLAGVTEIDAGGMGELARAYNLAVAAGGALRITRPTRRVRKMLEQVGLFDILTQERG
jgi:anti-anti-sigma factor